MLNIIDRICRWIDVRTQGAPMPDVYKEARTRATHARDLAKHTIFRHQYIQHMAEAKLAALEAWETKHKAERFLQAERDIATLYTEVPPLSRAKDERYTESS